MNRADEGLRRTAGRGSNERSPAAEHHQRRAVWEQKYAIRACYRSWYERMRPFTTVGPSIEIGAGSGGLKDFWPGLRTTDLVPTPHIDVAADAGRLPFADDSIANVVCIDLLHHLIDPHGFLHETARVLRPGGRMLAIEPYLTPFSWPVYRAFHHEDVWFRGYQRRQAGGKTDPWQGNLAVANLLFDRELSDWDRRHPELRIRHRRPFSLLDFQLAGGFKRYSFLPFRRLYDLVLRLDRHLDWLAPLAGFRILVVFERRQVSDPGAG